MSNYKIYKGEIMMQVKLSDIFSVEYLDIITKYKDRIQEMFKTYDVIIFMARKAICFYKALVINNEVCPDDKCTILSSRVLSYNVVKKFKGKKIAIVDDVVVRGKSLSYSKKIFEKNNINVDIHFIACEKGFIDSVDFIDSIKSQYKYLSDTNIYQLSNYITEYIEASMVPYNIDQPIYTIKYDSTWLNKNNVSNITDGLQKKYEIQNLTIHFNSQISKEFLGSNIEFENAFFKIRFLHHLNSPEMIAIPFVLLPEISYEVLDKMFNKFGGNDLQEYISQKNKQKEHENKLKVLQYLLSNALFIKFSNSIGAESVFKDLENEYMQFAIEISNDNLLNDHIHSISELSYVNQIASIDSYFNFDLLLSDTYDYIFSPMQESYYDDQGCIQEQKIITFNGLTTYINENRRNFDKYSISCIFDILIDKGILVPSIVHGKNDSIVRGYKCGEIFNLTKNGISLFAYMLDRYAELKEGKPIDKVELEKLCVLFFKNAAYRNRLFSASKTFDDDCFSICYSKFGPRVSNCNKKYKVGSRSALATIMEENGMVSLNKEKYKIAMANKPKDEKWILIAENFALSYNHLYKCFLDQDVRNRLVHTYNDFLTLLAIGSNKKNQMLSLIAELYLMTRIDTTATLNEILREMDHYSEIDYQSRILPKYQGIMDGIGSGIWKFSCFCQDDLMDSLFSAARKKQSDVRFIKEDYLVGIDENDENPIYNDLIDECGNLLYEIVYLFNYAQKRYSGNDINKIFKKSAFYNKRYDMMRHGIMKKCETSTEEELVSDFCTLKKRALALVNKCDLCIEDAALNKIRIYDDIFVLFHPNKILSKVGLEINLCCNNESDVIGKCIFIKCDKNDKFEKQLNEIVERYNVQQEKILFLFFDIDNLYEGVFESYHSATGDYFKTLVKTVVNQNRYEPDNPKNKVIICTRKNTYKENIYCDNFMLKYSCCDEAFDGYKCLQYILLDKEVCNMKKDNSENIVIEGGVIIKDSVIGAIGAENTVNQSISSQKSTDCFYRDVENMNLDVLNDDATLAKAKEIQSDAKSKNKNETLLKLKDLAISVGSSVFAKLVSTTIIDTMKDRGFFPF